VNRLGNRRPVMPVFKIQKRFGHGGVPEKLMLPPDGVDPLPPVETWTDDLGAVPTHTHPVEYQTGLKFRNWHNYQDKPMPKLFPSAEENLRLWQDIHVEKMLDNLPGHEIHASELPDYHFWPMIQNDVEPKFTGQVSTLVQYQYHTDQHEIPRFHKNGMPKTPPQEQVWYTPLTDEGRCDWRAVMARWCGTEKITTTFHKKGWNDRYLRYVYIDSVFAMRNGLKMVNVNKPALFKHIEMDKNKKFYRLRRGTKIADPLIFVALYWWIVGGTAAGVATYSDLNWRDEPWNYDMFYMKYFRDNAAFHPPV